MTNETNNIANKKVLLIEDDKFFSEVIAKKLSGTNCVFTHASTGEEAMPLLQADVPDAVILDLMLPGSIDGFGVLQKMRADDKLKDVPVIILSNLSRTEDIERGMKLGAFRYLVKASIMPGEIVTYLSSIFSSKVK